jgi:ABC-type glycerol-3-phosphate transport system substrate-binding protein
MTNIRSFMAFAERQTLIDAGRAAMWVKNSNDVYLFSGSTNGEASSDPRTGIVPLPAGPNGERIGGYNLTGGYFISANSQAHQACWEWLVFLTEQPGNWQFLPVRTAVAQSQTFRNGAGDELTAAFLTTIEEETQPSLNQRLTQTESWLDITTVWLMSAYDKALHENVPVEDALNRVQEIANVYQECLIRQDAYAAGKVQDNCLREADPSLPASFFTSNEE